MAHNLVAIRSKKKRDQTNTQLFTSDCNNQRSASSKLIDYYDLQVTHSAPNYKSFDFFDLKFDHSSY